ncbi:MAG: hypothetical protein O2930_05480 [Acidobacteria bacterium]|nr:hypothetical protein [Acidobacteriota bacterium]
MVVFLRGTSVLPFSVEPLGLRDGRLSRGRQTDQTTAAGIALHRLHECRRRE